MLIDSKSCHLQIGTTNYQKTELFVRGITPPTVCDYQPFSKIVEVDEGSAIRHGFSSVTYTWDNIDSSSLYRLKTMVNDALSTDRQFNIRIPLNDGSVIGRAFQDFTGIVIPISNEEQGLMAGRGVIFNSLTLIVNNLVPV